MTIDIQAVYGLDRISNKHTICIRSRQKHLAELLRLLRAYQ